MSQRSTEEMMRDPYGDFAFDNLPKDLLTMFDELSIFSMSEIDAGQGYVKESVNSYAKEFNNDPKVEGPKVVHEVVEPRETPGIPSIKYIMPLEAMRQMFLEVQDSVELKLDIDHISKLKCSSSYELENVVGSIVNVQECTGYSAKPHKAMYKIAAQFLKKMTGKILVVGDPSGSIAQQTDYRFTYVPCENRECSNVFGFTWSRDAHKNNPEGFEKMINDEEVVMDNYDIVVFLFRQDKYSRNFMKEAARKNKIIITFDIDGYHPDLTSASSTEYYYHGVLFNRTCEPEAELIHRLPHALFDVITDRIGSVFTWITNDVSWIWSKLLPVRVGMNPMSVPLLKLSYYKSDIYVGKTIILTVRGNQAQLKTETGINKGIFTTELPEGIYVSTDVGSEYLDLIINEPIFSEGMSDIRDFVEYEQFCPIVGYINERPVKLKHWEKVKPGEDLFEYQYSEGIAVRASNDLFGKRDYLTGKLTTLFLKPPSKVTYDEKLKLQFGEKGEVIVVGISGVYSDPYRVFVDSGVYEVNMRHQIIKHKLKYKPDSMWYVTKMKEMYLLNQSNFKYMDRKEQQYRFVYDNGVTKIFPQLVNLGGFSASMVKSKKNEFVYKMPHKNAPYVQHGMMVAFSGKHYRVEIREKKIGEETTKVIRMVPHGTKMFKRLKFLRRKKGRYKSTNLVEDDNEVGLKEGEVQ